MQGVFTVKLEMNRFKFEIKNPDTHHFAPFPVQREYSLKIPSLTDLVKFTLKWDMHYFKRSLQYIACIIKTIF